MTIPLWVSIIIALIAGLSAGVFAPIVTAQLSQRNWRSQKLLELKYDTFKGATAALASLLRDAMDVRLQSTKAEWKGMSRQIEIRPETSEALEQYRNLIGAFFSKNVAQQYDNAIGTKISLENIPNIEFEDRRFAFIEAASHELELKRRGWFSWVKGRVSQ